MEVLEISHCFFTFFGYCQYNTAVILTSIVILVKHCSRCRNNIVASPSVATPFLGYRQCRMYFLANYTAYSVVYSVDRANIMMENFYIPGHSNLLSNGK